MLRCQENTAEPMVLMRVIYTVIYTLVTLYGTDHFIIEDKSVSCLVLCSQAAKVVGVKAHTELDRRQVMLDLYLR